MVQELAKFKKKKTNIIINILTIYHLKKKQLYGHVFKNNDFDGKDLKVAIMFWLFFVK
jgi:hypothetical protein